ncbi:MAG: acyl-CoA/acyl-ACP dehydrogenase [Candidatus Heimdallarchaeota archaeon]|nr:acyl-CoA/acyl-ACP dehydrogenase [Candidatus Heimdallarchaeota archaeon]MDH5646209.1 acyl-CoA/acyl-ACP dehydrogenase [Candidatus Heimdallarchaeota archaeon]
MVFEVESTIKSILEKHNIREEARNWDHTGVKLVDGKVILPDTFLKVVNEIIQENQLLSFYVPEELGGLGFGDSIHGPITEVLAGYDFAMEIFILISASVIESLLLYHKEDYNKVIKEFTEGKRLGYVAFTEPQAGSNLENIKATSEKVGDEYVLNGTKIFITNGGYANTGLFLAQNIVNGKREGTNVFLVDNLDGITTLRLEEKSGLHVSPTAQLQFENVTVPEEYIISDVGNGYRKVLDRLMGMRVGVSYQTVAAAKRAFEVSLDYAQNREQFGRQIIEFPEVRRKLKQMMIQIPRMEDYTYQAAVMLERYKLGWIPYDAGIHQTPEEEINAANNAPPGLIPVLAHYLASCSKLYTSEIVNQFLYDAQQIFGGMGFIAETEVNKIARDVRITSIYEGTSEIHNWVINRAQKQIDSLTDFERPYRKYQERTIYENILFTRFPDLDKKI